MFIFIYKKFKYKILSWKFNKKLALQILKDSWPLLFVGAFTLIYSRIDQVMVKQFIDQTAVGLYGAAVTIAEIWYFIPAIIISSLFPAIVNSKKINENVYKKRLYDLLLLLIIISLSYFSTHIYFSKTNYPYYFWIFIPFGSFYITNLCLGRNWLGYNECFKSVPH